MIRSAFSFGALAILIGMGILWYKSEPRNKVQETGTEDHLRPLEEVMPPLAPIEEAVEQGSEGHQSPMPAGTSCCAGVNPREKH